MKLRWNVAVFVTAFAAVMSAGAQETEEIQITVEQVADGVYMLQGRGGNIGVSAGEDGVFLIDDQYAPLTDAIVEAVRRVSEEPLRFVLNTHWHWDHTGGNENLAGKGVLIVAHDNVRKRMSTDQFIALFDASIPASPEVALPVITFDSSTTFHINGDAIRFFHVAKAHTDSDSIIHFQNANVVHMGDVYFNGLFPFIDTGTGGSVDGVIEAVELTLTLVDDDTRIIPGHGPLSNKTELAEYRDLLVTVRDRISAMIAQGKTLEEVMAAAPAAEYNEKWGQGFLPAERWVPMMYEALGGR